jgi:hypothetical protein
MASSSHQAVHSLRMTAEDVRKREEAGEPVTFLDVRNPQAWESSPIKIAGAIRALAGQFRIDPSWPKDRLTVVY